jgi:hypothetical protein
VPVAAGRVGLPDLDECISFRPAVLVGNPAVYDDALAERYTASDLAGEIQGRASQPGRPAARTTDLGSRARDPDRRVLRGAFRTGAISRARVRRVDPWRDRPEHVQAAAAVTSRRQSPAKLSRAPVCACKVSGARPAIMSVTTRPDGVTSMTARSE